ncbi:hypothetical protein LCGC14_0209360 [marine sediment metagenome]|uniref:Uncharacterized protein n=1 Tax=marine sediment metagenome TaxID=412755 RepID=A0A0F9UGU8_9ZZZZ
MVNGNGWVKPVLIGVAVLVLASAVIGSTTNTIANSIGRRGLEVEVSAIKEDVDEQKEAVRSIPVMASQIKDIKADVGKILEELRK